MGFYIVLNVARFHGESVRVHAHRGEVVALEIGPGVHLEDDILGFGRVEHRLQLLARARQTEAGAREQEEGESSAPGGGEPARSLASFVCCRGEMLSNKRLEEGRQAHNAEPGNTSCIL